MWLYTCMFLARDICALATSTGSLKLYTAPKYYHQTVRGIRKKLDFQGVHGKTLKLLNQLGINSTNADFNIGSSVV